MINNKFWKDAASSWAWNAKADIHIKAGSGGQIAEELLENPWDIIDDDFVDFNEIDYDATVKAIMEGGDAILKGQVEEIASSTEICLDLDKFDNYLELETIEGYIQCFKMLKDCSLSDVMNKIFEELIKRMGALEDATKKFKKIYEADISMFMEIYIPEALNLSVGYIEYVNAKVDETILTSTQNEVVEALDTLLIGINDKIDEIYKFSSIELKAAAKALNANMNMDGYIDSKFKIN